MRRKRYNYDDFDELEDEGIGLFGIIVIAAAVVFVLSLFGGLLSKQKTNAAETSKAAIEAGETIELNKQYKSKTNKNDKDHIYYKTYIFEIDQPGQIGVEFSCKSNPINKCHNVSWEIIDVDNNNEITKSQYHSFEVEMVDIQPGKYAIQFYSTAHSVLELTPDRIKRPFEFKLIFNN